MCFSPGGGIHRNRTCRPSGPSARTSAQYASLLSPLSKRKNFLRNLEIWHILAIFSKSVWFYALSYFSRQNVPNFSFLVCSLAYHAVNGVCRPSVLSPGFAPWHPSPLARADLALASTIPCHNPVSPGMPPVSHAALFLSQLLTLTRWLAPFSRSVASPPWADIAKCCR